MAGLIKDRTLLATASIGVQSVQDEGRRTVEQLRQSEGEGRTSTTSAGFRKHDRGLHTVYALTFQGIPSSRPLPQRAETSDHFPTAWPFETSQYSSIFTRKQYNRYTMKPASVHRKNNPHPMVFDPWRHPDMGYQIWKSRKTQSAPGVTKIRDLRQPWSTTYDASFTGKNFDKLPRIIPGYAQKNPAYECNNGPSQTPLYMRSMYRHDYIGETGRPSTMERPWDRSFQNLSM